MRIWHGAALALAGWYLMVPTPYGRNGLYYVPDLPLAKWTAMQSFETADDCRQMLDIEALRTTNDLPHSGAINDASAQGRLAFLYGQAECIASDDPRLKP